MIFSKEKLSSKILLDLLKKANNSFVPEPLSVKVDLVSYAKKLADNSIHFSCFESLKLIGVTCCYMNDLDSKKAFISVTCVDPAFQGKGIGQKLTKLCEDEAVNMGFSFVEFEVHSQNTPSIKMHKKIGYYIDRKEKESFFMRKILLDE